MPSKTKSVDHLKWKEEQLKFEKDAYLRKRGWDSTCSVPGSYWLWTITHKGQKLMADTQLALSMQASIEADECECDDFDVEGCPLHDFK